MRMFFGCLAVSFHVFIILHSAKCFSFVKNHKLVNSSVTSESGGHEVHTETQQNKFSLCNLQWKQVNSVDLPSLDGRSDLIKYSLTESVNYFIFKSTWRANGVMQCENKCSKCQIYYIDQVTDCKEAFKNESNYYLLQNPRNCSFGWSDIGDDLPLAACPKDPGDARDEPCRTAGINRSFPFVESQPIVFALPFRKDEWKLLYINDIKHFLVEEVKVDKSQEKQQIRTEISHEELHNSLNQPWSFTVVGQEARDTTFHVEVPEEYSIDIHSRKNIPKLEELTDAEFEFLFDLLPTHGKQEKTISLPKSLSQTYLVDRHSCATVVINERKTSERETLKVELRMLPNPIWNESEREAAFRYINGPKMDRENLLVAVTLNRSTTSFNRTHELPLRMFIRSRLSHAASLLSERAPVFYIAASLTTMFNHRLVRL